MQIQADFLLQKTLIMLEPSCCLAEADLDTIFETLGLESLFEPFELKAANPT